MQTNVFLIPNIETAIRHTAEQIADSRREDALYPIQVLMPTADSLRLVRERLGNSIGIYLYQFYALGQSILDSADISVQWLDETAIRRLVHHILNEMHIQGELSTFDDVWEKPGFTQTVLDWLREMKAQGIAPEQFEANAPHSENSRDAQLLLLYQRYQDFMHRNALSDSDGLLWLAAEALENNPTLLRGEGLVIALGFDQYTPIQFRILRAYAERFDAFSVYLPWDIARSDESLAHIRMKETRSELLRMFPDANIIALPDNSQTASDLRHLQVNLFEHKGIKEKAPSIHAYTAPSREIEVRTALREIKKLLLDGVPAEEIHLLAPKPGIYQRIVELVAEEFGIPVNHEKVLGANPAVQALLNLLDLAPDFPRRQTLDALRSPYIQQTWLNEQQIGYLTQLTRERPVIREKSQWKEALLPIEYSDTAEEDEELGPEKLATKLGKDELAAIEAGLLSFFAHITPPVQATHRQFTLWIQEKILGFAYNEEGENDIEQHASLNFLLCCEKTIHAARDLSAMSAVLQHMRRLVDAAELIPSTEKGQVDWKVYRGDLFEVVPNLPHLPDPVEVLVQFGPLELGRYRPSNYLFVLGLSEGEFPSAPTADPLYAPSERKAYPEAYNLNLRTPYSADDASLWWLVLSNCHRALILLRPAIDEGGALWQASPYWDEVMKKADVAINEIKIGALPAIDNAASQAELLTALAIAKAKEVPAELSAAWRSAQNGFNVMRLRRSWVPVPPFEGVLQAEDIKQALSTRYDDNHSWSASRLNRYGSCPFGFFAQYVLMLEDDYEPEEGMDVMQRGSVLHNILEHLYRRLSTDGLALTPDTQDTVLSCLDEVCEYVFERAPQKLGFRPNSLWHFEQQELRRLLTFMVKWECESNSGYIPLYQEFRFGVRGTKFASYPLIDSNETTILFHGVVDRVDRNAEGGLRVIDYKSGSTEYSKEDMAQGRAFQNPLYAHVVSRLLEMPVLESAYLLLPKREYSGKLQFAEGQPLGDDTVRTAVDSAGNFVRRIRSGYFPSLPSKPTGGNLACSTYCQFSGFCRVNRRGLAKARRMEAQHGN